MLTGALFAALSACLALASGVRGIGYYSCPLCTGPGGDVVELNPFIYLPYVVAGLSRGIALGGLANWTLADVFAATPDLYAWTIVWWIAVSLLAGRLLSAGISRLRNRNRKLGADDNPTP